MDLYQRSIEIILANQHPSGAYVACPNFPTYRYCWFRDGSFIAYAMDLAEQHESARRFYAWAARAILSREAVIKRALEMTARGEALTEADVLHTRYTLEGEDGTQQAWANFQLDGFGTWLWALCEHQDKGGQSLSDDCLHAAGLVADYLTGLWRLPNFDLWEEYGDHVHAHTLAAIYGGLNAFAFLRKKVNGRHLPLAEIRAYLEEHFVWDGHFVKFPGRGAVDASLLGLSVPYGVFPLDDARMQATLSEIERTLLVKKGGLHRYAADRYYGGGEWVLLAAWLGWVYAQQARAAGPAPAPACRGLLTWIENQAALDGCLPEQIPAHLNHPAAYPEWLQREGAVATPLLWSHAAYIILKKMMPG